MERCVFPVSNFMWPSVFVPRVRTYVDECGHFRHMDPIQTRASVSFSPDEVPEELRPFAYVRPERVTEHRTLPASVTAGSNFSVTIIPDDIPGLRLVAADAEACRVAMDTLLRGTAGELCCSGWSNMGGRTFYGERRESRGLNLIAVRVSVAAMADRLKAILQHPEDKL